MGTVRIFEVMFGTSEVMEMFTSGNYEHKYR